MSWQLHPIRSFGFLSGHLLEDYWDGLAFYAESVYPATPPTADLSHTANSLAPLIGLSLAMARANVYSADFFKIAELRESARELYRFSRAIERSHYSVSWTTSGPSFSPLPESTILAVQSFRQSFGRLEEDLNLASFAFSTAKADLRDVLTTVHSDVENQIGIRHCVVSYDLIRDADADAEFLSLLPDFDTDRKCSPDLWECNAVFDSFVRLPDGEVGFRSRTRADLSRRRSFGDLKRKRALEWISTQEIATLIDKDETLIRHWSAGKKLPDSDDPFPKIQNGKRRPSQYVRDEVIAWLERNKIAIVG